MTTDLDDRLVRYFAARQQERTDEVTAVLDLMTKRERALVREVAVMANVRASLGRRKQPVAPDTQVLYDTLSACLAMPDLYPTVARIARRAQRQAARS